MGARVIEALGIETSATHMEWFYGPKGLRFCEIGCRPPGSARGTSTPPPTTSTSTASGPTASSTVARSRALSRAVLRGDHRAAPRRDGTIHGYDGLDEIRDRYGEWVIDAHLPDPGTPTQPVEAGYMANAYVRMKHPDYDMLRGMLDDVGRTVHVHAG